MKGYRTIAIGVMVTLIAVVNGISGSPEASEFLSGKVLNILLGVSGVATVLLRLITNTPVGRKR